MKFVTEFPLLNPLRFLPVSDNAYNDSMLWWQTSAPYYQKVQQDDRITIQVHTQSNAGAYPPTLKIVDEDDYVIDSIDLSAYYRGTVTVAGNTAEDGTALDTTLWSFKFSQLALPDGIYCFLLTNNYDGANTKQYKSEPFDVMAEHEDTILLGYLPSDDDPKDIIKSGFLVTPILNHRVEGTIYKYQPMSNMVGALDQAFNSHMLKGESFDTYMLQIGGETGVPDYEVQKVAHIITCPYFTANNKKFVYYGQQSSGTGSAQAVMQVQRPDVRYPLVTGEVAIALTDNRDAYTFINNKIKLFDIPATYPFVFPHLMQMKNSDLHFIADWDSRVIEDSAGLDTYITYLGVDFSVDNDLTGTFIRDNDAGAVYYQVGIGENWVEYVNDTSTLYITVPVTTSVVNLIMTFVYKEGDIVVDWDDNTVDWKSAFGSTAEISLSHKYAAAGNYSMRIFFDNTNTYLKFYKGTGTSPDITNLPTGYVPTVLKEFWMLNYDLSANVNVDPTFLKSAASSLQTIAFSGTKIKAFSPHLFTLTGIGIPPRWYSLIMFTVTGNKLTSTEIDNLINDFKNTIYTNGGLFYTRYQSPTQPRTAASDTAYNFIHDTKLWNLILDV